MLAACRAAAAQPLGPEVLLLLVLLVGALAGWGKQLPVLQHHHLQVCIGWMRQLRKQALPQSSSNSSSKLQGQAQQQQQAVVVLCCGMPLVSCQKRWPLFQVL